MATGVNDGDTGLSPSGRLENPSMAERTEEQRLSTERPRSGRQSAEQPTSSRPQVVRSSTSQSNRKASTTQQTFVQRARGLSNPAALYNAGKDLLEAEIPSGMWSATGIKTSQAPTLPDIRRGNYETDPEERQKRIDAIEEEKFTEGAGKGRRGSRTRGSTDARARRQSQEPTIAEQQEDRSAERAEEIEQPAQNLDRIQTALDNDDDNGKEPRVNERRATTNSIFAPGSHELRLTKSGMYPNGYRFPPKHTWKESTVIGFWAFMRFVSTPLGIIMFIYGLNVVGWGAMIFFLLIEAAPAMCHVQQPLGSGHVVSDCNALYSPRRIWIEIDSQVLTALFCVTAFGLAPWRFRDFYYLMKWRLMRDNNSLRRLAAWHSSWFRLPGSQNLHPVSNTPVFHEDDDSLPIPSEKAPNPPLTGVRAQPTALWRMDFVIWMFLLNTLFQVVLCVFMWHENRFERPSWATGLFVSLGCVSAGVGGVMQFTEGKRIKQVEGIPYDVGATVEDVSRQISRADGEAQTEIELKGDEKV